MALRGGREAESPACRAKFEKRLIRRLTDPLRACSWVSTRRLGTTAAAMATPATAATPKNTRVPLWEAAPPAGPLEELLTEPPSPPTPEEPPSEAELLPETPLTEEPPDDVLLPEAPLTEEPPDEEPVDELDDELDPPEDEPPELDPPEDEPPELDPPEDEPPELDPPEDELPVPDVEPEVESDAAVFGFFG
jgi:hypothetical protein